MKQADLHVHTVASDGTDTLEERIRDAEEKGLDVIAITDHDTVNEGLEDRSFVAGNGVEVVTGSEIKCEIDGTKIEILGYFIDPEGDGIQELLRKLSERREERMERFVENLNESRGLELEIEEVLEKADGNVGRPHLAEALVDEGVVETVQEAFERFIGEEHEEYVEVEKVPAGEVIQKVHRNGGVTSLAHPGRDLEDEAEEKIRELAEKGLDALEVKYTYEEKKDMESYGVYFGEERASELADRFDLLKTGGSDCHGSGSGKYFLGNVKIPGEKVEGLRRISESG